MFDALFGAIEFDYVPESQPQVSEQTQEMHICHGSLPTSTMI
jgi:hypothetical protein